MILTLVITSFALTLPMAGAIESPSPALDVQTSFDEEIQTENQYPASDIADESTEEILPSVDFPEETLPSVDFPEETLPSTDTESDNSAIRVLPDGELKPDLNPGNDTMNNDSPKETETAFDNTEEIVLNEQGEGLPTIHEDEQILVTVPGNGSAIVNPYGMKVTLAGEESFDQIVSTNQTITNYSTFPISVLASAEGHIYEQSDAFFVSEPPQKDSMEKEIFVYAEFRKSEDEWHDIFSDTDSQILIDERQSEQKAVLQLEADGAEGEFRLFGETTFSPEEPWDENDAFEVVITFTFLPLQGDIAMPTEIGNEMPTVENNETFSNFEENISDDTQSSMDPDFESVPNFDTTPNTEQEIISTPETEDDPIAFPDADTEDNSGSLPELDLGNGYSSIQYDQASGVSSESVLFDESK